LVLAVLPLVWLLASIFLPEVFWFPISVGAVVWKGVDGQGGISHFLD